MKKIFVSLALCAAVITANAQTTVQGSKFTDNWSIGLNVGGTTPLTHSPFFKNMRGVFGLDLGKQVTPVLGFDLEGMAAINTTDSKTAIDNTSLNLLSRVNMNNLFAGYKGAPRLFEIETVAGLGWLHYIQNGSGDLNSLAAKLGLNFNFNLGEKKAWTLAIKPALVYDLQENTALRFNADRAAWEFTAGIRYHFKNSNGKHHFIPIVARSQSEIDGLNNQINSLREELDGKNDALDKANRRADNLEKALNECQNQPKVVEGDCDKIMESIVTFPQNGIYVQNSQVPNVERVAVYMQNHKEAKVIVKGYASPEGPAEVNDRISKQRAEAVKDMLVKRYGIEADRIEATGEGVGSIFEGEKLNRVSICTINKD